MNIALVSVILSIAASLAAIVSVFVAARATSRGAGLRYLKLTLNIVNDPTNLARVSIVEDKGEYQKRIPGLRIAFEGKECPRLSVTRIVFWNAGRKLIDGTDIAIADPIRVEAVLKSIQIRRAYILKSTNRGSGVILNSDQTGCTVTFDYLEPGEGFIVEFLHTGYRNSALRVRGSIRGSGAVATEQSLDSSGAARIGFFLARRPKLTRGIVVVLMLVNAYYFYMALDAFYIFDFAGYAEAMRERYVGATTRQLRVMYATAFFMLNYLLVMGVVAGLTIWFKQRPPVALKSFETEWPWFDRNSDE